MSTQEVLIRIQATPNPNAWKFVLDRPVLLEGKATYSNADEAYGNRMALDLITIEGVKQVHFFQNVITITHRIDVDPEKLQQEVCSVIQTRLPVHDPSYGIQKSKLDLRKTLPEDVQQIEAILDRTIRPGLQGDGGDIEVIKFEDNKLYVHYEGACGTCPSSTTGTLMAIEGILRDELNTQIEVIPL
ncbi:MAG: NifU family protein [Bdellovibrio sp. CG10_big_fil_rev_8_21_14_0_10_47_8]|nr:MAG: NifU family protein [Bdellovibrio sp. CG10_big_fil_rev_8_21_14_0_10_47_8]